MVHLTLDVAGMIPIVGAVADLANAGLYVAERDWENAALSAAAAVPGLGYMAVSARYAMKGAKAAEASYRVAQTARIAGALDIGVNLGASGYFVGKGVATGSASTAALGALGGALNVGVWNKVVGGGGVSKSVPSVTKATDSLPTSTGVLGGQLYGADRLAKLEGYLGRRGVQLKVGDEFVPKGKAAGFAIDGSELVLPSNPTQYTVWHELAHFRQFQQIGPEAYKALPRPANFSGLQNVPEQYVFDALENSPRRWNALNHAEQQHAIWSVQTVYGGIR